MQQNAYLLLTPVVLVNLWHAYLISWPRSKKPGTISEHALLTQNRLYIHRLVHCLSSATLMAYAYQNRELFGWTATLLVAGAVFDVIEVFTLSRSIAKSPLDLSDPHQLTSWLMANSYLAFVIFAGMHVGLAYIASLTFCVLYSLLFILILALKFRLFWLIQMAYFVILGAHMTTISLHL